MLMAFMANKGGQIKDYSHLCEQLNTIYTLVRILVIIQGICTSTPLHHLICDMADYTDKNLYTK